MGRAGDVDERERLLLKVSEVAAMLVLLARIGHVSPIAAPIYQHATEQRDRQIAAYLDGAIPEP